MSFLALKDRFASAPETWREAPFIRVFQPVERRAGVGGAHRLSLASAGQLYPREGAVDRQRASDKTEARSLLVEPGDLVINPMWLTGGSIAVSNVEGAVSPDYRVFRPSSLVHPRYAHHLLRSQPYMDQYRLFVRANTTFDRRIQQVDLDAMPLTLPSVDEQRRIADFLDDRVARIDRIIAARREQAKLSELLAKAKLDQLVTVADSTVRPLQALTDPERPIQYGIVLPGPDFEGGIPIIKGGDIGSGRLATGILNRTDPEIERAFARSRVRPGDYVIAIRGSVGELGAVPPELRLANLTQDSARIAPRNCEASWLVSVLRSPKVQGEIAQRVTGSTVKGINIADLRRIPIPVPSVHDQKRIGGLAERLESGRVARDLALRRSIDLLTEYKQSLITAAVTGELDVTTTGSGVPR